ncbi:MAG: murein L,D-transpeptidase catalytic domain family protein [Saprospiraceae bacterium]|nr:murein L,D-transpeptidase catalytic domain family protein [Saprospiraceae bacterium]
MRPTVFILAGLVLWSSQCFAESTHAMLSRLAPEINPRVLSVALEARDCAAKNLSQSLSPRLAVIDYSLPSTERRLWVFDIEARKLLFAEHVAHGQGTGENFARDFSNRDGSHQTSLGLFRTAGTYSGKNGYSLKMEGLEPGTNDAAMARAIVMHGAPYVNPAAAKQQGRLGRSWGCPAVRPEVAEAVIDSLKNGQMIFAYYPDSNWLARSPFIDCRRKENLAASRQNAKLGDMTLSDANTATTAR